MTFNFTIMVAMFMERTKVRRQKNPGQRLDVYHVIFEPVEETRGKRKTKEQSWTEGVVGIEAKRRE